MPRAVDTNLGTRCIKGWSRGSKTEVPLSLICLRHQTSNGVIRWFWFMCKSTTNTHTTPLRLLHFPSLLCRDSGYINSSWAHKFREPLWKENSETKGRDRHFQCCFVFAAGSSETAVQTAEAAGHRVGTSYETGSHSSPLHMGPWWDAGSIPSFGLLLPQPAPLWLKGTGAKGQAPWCPRSCSDSSVLSTMCCHPPARVCGWGRKSHTIAGALGEQSLSTRSVWLSVHGSWMVFLQHIYWEKKAAIRKSTQKLSSLMNLMSYVIL